MCKEPFSREKAIAFALFEVRERRAGFTLMELIIAASLLSMVALLIYPAYRTNSRSYQLSVVESSLQQNTRIGMKKIAKELGIGMVVIPEEGSEATDGSGNNYGYDKAHPYKMAFYSWDITPEETSDNNKIAIYTALPSLDVEPIDPALISPEDKPLLYIRRYTSSWENPEPLTLSDVKINQLNFIIGGDNENEILITLELSREGPIEEWRTYKITSAAKLGAR